MLRRGEACAITHEDILPGGTLLSVRKSIRWSGNRPAVVAPKTDAGYRVIPLPSIRLDFEAFRGYVTGGHTPPTLQAFNRGFASFMTAVGVVLNGCTKRWQPPGHQWREPNIRPHDLRHTFATLLFDAGVDIKTAQRWLGHSSPELTLRIYTHLTEERQAQSTDAFSAHFAAYTNAQPNVQPKPDQIGCTPSPTALAKQTKKPPKSK